MFTRTALAGVVMAAMTSVSASAATLIDFTDTTVWTDGSSTTVVSGSTVSLSSVGGPITVNPGPIAVDDGGLGLALLGDGLGVNDDEITNPAQSITVSFSGLGLRVNGFAFLDLFIAKDGSEKEVARVQFNDGTVMTFDAVNVSNGGFGFFGFAPKEATSVTFTALSTNDKRANPDLAVAAISVAPIPLPAAGWLFVSALVGMGVLSRRRNAA